MTPNFDNLASLLMETSIPGPVVGADPDVLGTGKTGKEIYVAALQAAADLNKVIRSDITPRFDKDEWINAKKGDKLSGRPEFNLNADLGATLAWTIDNLSHSGRPKGHWTFHSQFLRR